ncbi:nitrite reductase small subunit NirD [Enterococcus sp. BWB1-3]|uniref:nitrite reductase small subunit NirD n=1 Tax=unclassified Enterococcus TaxID=2608891 RepID=UPI0019239C26|nr:MULTISPECIES: nitrite reductase small subunit NirD [unclassified Enterococcus]MBL1228853.1 nitrite reductase small subunit NirD [Enterococcus sp. BWB1-3]MCB5951604.1 nitrite reductase small subunit NirD [Enterococcus sp. BWT-B8]MCB5954696.1 nitrite reductase small subunit NirD [Enterococcus sp. CWB-B31]
MEKIFVASLSELVPRIGREVLIGDQKIAVYRLSDDRVKAIENVCPHKQGPLAEGIVSGDFVFCPLHDYKISLNDGIVQDPDEGCVRTFETMVEGDKVYVMVD